jgi:hypothetical protein
VNINDAVGGGGWTPHTHGRSERSEWPTLSDRHVVACVEAYIKARDEFQDAIKEVKQ